MSKEPYGMELILDLHDCDPSTFTRTSIETYFVKLCRLIDMERCDLHFWDDEGLPEAECQTNPKTKGISAVQFILTSSIVIHTLEITETAYINIFSCENFNADEATAFTKGWFGSSDTTSLVIKRE